MKHKFYPGILTNIAWKTSFLSILALACSNLFATQVVVTDIGTLGGEWSDAYAINDLDQVVGLSETASGSSHTFLFSNGQLSDLYPLNGQISEPIGLNNLGQVASGMIADDGIYYPAVYDSRTGQIMVPGSFGGVNGAGLAGAATAINDVGQVVGYSYIPSGEWHAFMYDKGVMRDLGAVSGDTTIYYSYALGINHSGQIVGGTGSQHGFLYGNGVMSQFEPPNSAESRAYSINNSGQVVGYYYEGDTGHAFLYSENQFTRISPPGSPYTVAFSINEQGQLVGSTWLPDYDSCRTCFQPRAFIYDNGELIDLNTMLPAGSPWTLRYAYGINNNGKIIGQGVINGEFHAFVLKFTSPGSTKVSPASQHPHMRMRVSER